MCAESQFETPPPSVLNFSPSSQRVGPKIGQVTSQVDEGEEVSCALRRVGVCSEWLSWAFKTSSTSVSRLIFLILTTTCGNKSMFFALNSLAALCCVIQTNTSDQGCSMCHACWCMRLLGRVANGAKEVRGLGSGAGLRLMVRGRQRKVSAERRLMTRKRCGGGFGAVSTRSRSCDNSIIVVNV
jgi:hypothetical protein